METINKFATLMMGVLIIFSGLLFLENPKETITGNAVIKEGTFFREEITSYPAKIYVTENQSRLGMSVDTFHLDFGIVPVGSFTTKTITLKNDDERTSKVEVEVNGDISDLIEFNKNNFLLKGFEETEIKVKAIGRRPGNYTGEVSIKIVKSNYKELGVLLPWI